MANLQNVKCYTVIQNIHNKVIWRPTSKEKEKKWRIRKTTFWSGTVGPLSRFWHDKCTQWTLLDNRPQKVSKVAQRDGPLSPIVFKLYRIILTLLSPPPRPCLSVSVSLSLSITPNTTQPSSPLSPHTCHKGPRDGSF